MNIQQFDYSVDVLSSFLWQFNASPNLETILRLKQEWYEQNHRDFWDNWFRDVFDLRTANDFGLAVWSLILNFPLTADQEGSPPDYPAWGFGEFHRNFERGNFATPAGEFAGLDTEQKRLILRLRAFSLFSNGTIPEINRFLVELFGEGVYVLDNLNMTIEYIFTVTPDSQVRFVLENFDILPRPSGVSSSIRIIPPISWAFGDQKQNFGHGNFYVGD